jgi:hypothetical protein
MQWNAKRFLVVVCILLPSTLILYRYVLHYYRSLVCALVRYALSVWPLQIRLSVVDEAVLSVEVPMSGERGAWRFFLSTESGYEAWLLGLAVLPVLILGMALPFKVTARLACVSLLLMLFVHTMSLISVVFISAEVCYRNEQERMCTIASSALSWSSTAVTLGVWALITWPYYVLEPVRIASR